MYRTKNMNIVHCIKALGMHVYKLLSTKNKNISIKKIHVRIDIFNSIRKTFKYKTDGCLLS